jgi:16S rRNA processing protein RimM
MLQAPNFVNEVYLKSSSNDEFVVVGVISGAKGLKGEVRLHLFSGEAAWAKKIKSVELTSKKDPLKSGQIKSPQAKTTKKVSSLKVFPNDFILKLEGVDTREAAEALKFMEVAIDPSLLKSSKGESFFLSELLGYKVFDGETLVGEITSFQTNEAQDLLVIGEGKGEILIPLVKDFTIKIDNEKKEVRMRLPEGLTAANVDKS